MLTAIEKALLLHDMDLLRFASVDHLIQLAEMCREETFKAGDILFHQGDQIAKIYLLVSGGAAFEGPEGQQLHQTALNLWPCLAGTTPPWTCRCQDDCTVLTLTADDLLDLLAGEPELSLALLKYTAQKQLGST